MPTPLPYLGRLRNRLRIGRGSSLLRLFTNLGIDVCLNVRGPERPSPAEFSAGNLTARSLSDHRLVVAVQYPCNLAGIKQITGHLGFG